MIDADQLTDAQRVLVRAATTAWMRGGPQGPGQPFVLSSDQLDEHPGWPDDVPLPGREEFRPLIHGAVFESLEQRQGTWVLGMTDGGIRLGTWLGADVPTGVTPFPHSLEWVDMIPILETVLRLSEDSPYPEGFAGFGDVERVRFASLAVALGHANRDPQLLRAVRTLADDGYLAFEERPPVEASELRALPRTLQLLRGWPSTEPEVVARRLDEALAAAIERTDDPEEKTRLQSLRDGARDVGKSVLAGAILAAGKYATGV